jgi:predicted PurR-regulated permease PerM
LAAQVASTTVNTVSNLFLIFVVAIYFAKDSRQFAGQIIDLAGNAGYAADADRLIRDFTRIWNAYLRGQVILGLVMGVVVGFSLVVLGVNNALGLGILAGVLEFLPVVGPLLSSLAAILVAFFQPDNWLGMSSFNYALTVAIVMILLQQLENNMLVPRIVGGALDLHPLLVMISVIMGASLAGILGAVLAAPVVASLKLFGGYIWRKLLDLPPFPQPEAEDRPPTQRLRLVAAWWLRVRRRATKVLQGR